MSRSPLSGPIPWNTTSTWRSSSRQSANAPAARFVSPKGGRFNPQRSTPRTFIITADIGAGGPAGVYAAQMQP